MRQSHFFLGTILGCQLLLPVASFAQIKKPVVPAKKPTAAAKKPVASASSVTQVVAPITLTFLDDDAEESFNLSFALKKSTAKQSLVFDYQDAKNYYLLEIDGTKPNITTAQFLVVQNGLRKLLSSAPVILNAQNNLVLQRRLWTMQLIVKDKIALRAFDPHWSEGKIGYIGTSFTELRVQPTEKVRFDDDFTRAGQGGDNDWKTQSGKWTLSASSEHVNSRNATMSSNPFAFEATSPKGEAFTTGGRWFWDSYDARVSVRPFGKGEVGIAAYVKDAKNYLAFKWSATDSSAARRIVQVTNGVETVLASGKGAYFSRQWYEIGLRLSPGYVEALLDGVPVLRAPTESLGQGGVGLWAKDIENAAFDDVRVRSYDFLRPQFAQNGAWQIQNGAWKFGGAQTDIAGNGIVTIGPKQNQNYRALISMPINGTGLITGWQDSKNYTLFRVLNGHAQIVRIENGKNLVLSDSPQKIITNRDGSTRFLLETTDGVLTVSSNDKIVAQSAGPKLTIGKFGLLANSKSTTPVSFKDPVLFFPPPPEPLKVAERMEKDPYMVGWASSDGEWIVPDPEIFEFWNAGEHFGDVTLYFPWRNVWEGTFDAALRAKRGEFASGMVLRGTRIKDSENVNWQLLQGEKVLAKGSMKLADLPNVDGPDGTTLEIALKGAGLVLSSAKGPILSFLGADAFKGTSLGIRSQGFRVRTDRLQTSTTNRDDYTFTGAPTDFYSLSGQWNIFSRWPCYGDWSFFGGEGQNPVLWTKRQYGGDVVAEFYAHPQMILPKEPGYSHPGDLNVSIGGDGKNPASGYSFVIAGWDNTRSALFRGNKLVADNSNSKSFFSNTINHDMRWHRRWINIRAEVRNAVKDGKKGAMVTLTLEDEKILEWFDEKPLESWKNGGRVAFWTIDSTMMIARAKIEAQEMGVKSLPAGLIDTRVVASPAVPSSETTIAPRNIAGEPSLSAIITRNANSWTVKNPIAGGVFSVGLNAPTTAITHDSQYAFDARIPEDVKIDLYAKVDGAWYTFELSGGQKNDPIASTIGKANVSAIADSTAKHYNFEIGSALAKEFPDQKSWNIEEVRLGAMQGNAYRWIGFDGNDFGDSYEIGGFQWR